MSTDVHLFRRDSVGRSDGTAAAHKLSSLHDKRRVGACVTALIMFKFVTFSDLAFFCNDRI